MNASDMLARLVECIEGYNQCLGNLKKHKLSVRNPEGQSRLTRWLDDALKFSRRIYQQELAILQHPEISSQVNDRPMKTEDVQASYAERTRVLMEVYFYLSRFHGHSTSLTPGGGLSAHEQLPIAHLLARHCVESPEHLRMRLRKKRKLNFASSFYSRELAESAVAQVLYSQRQEICAWLDTGEPELVFGRICVDKNVGAVLKRDSITPVPSARVTLVLGRDATAPLGFFIKTGYPDL